MELTQESASILGLSSIKGLGLKTFHKLFQQYGSVESILDAEYATLRSGGISAAISKDICDLGAGKLTDTFKTRLEKIESWLSENDRRVLSIDDPGYPQRLKHTFQPPPILYARGNVSALKLPSLAIVGSRKASIAGLRYAGEFASVLAQSGVNIVSGLALGIDTAAHRGALDVGGLTSAVLGTGVDVTYPRQNKQLAEQIVEVGVLLSEMPLGTMPVPANFPRRNRVVSGLADGVLVVEATEKSGSLITSKFALEQNRDVFAIPGPIESPGAVGTNNLIKQGAQLVSSPDEVLASLSLKIEVDGETTMNLQSGYSSHSQKCDEFDERYLELNDEEEKLYELIAHSTTSFDFIVQHSKLDPAKLSQELMMLELKGVIASVAGGYQRVKTINSRASERL